MSYLKTTLLSLFIGLACLNLSAQSSSNSEVGFWLGASNYVGDLNIGKSFESFKRIRPAGGFVYRYNASPYISLKTTGSFGYLSFDDALSSNPFPEVRNLNFESVLAEVGQHVEFHFNRYVVGDATWHTTPYLSLGISLFYFNPKTELNGADYFLQEIGTEGQQLGDLTGKEPYKLIQPAIPVGFGFKRWLANKWNLAFEVGYRFTFTDYIDDVGSVYLDDSIFPTSSVSGDLADRSEEVTTFAVGEEGRQRGDSVGKDAYIFAGLTLTYSIFKVKCK